MKNSIKCLLKNNAIKFCLLFIPISVLIFIYNYLTPLFADDYSYIYNFNGSGEKISSILDIFSSQYYHYFSMNGRTVLHFLAQVFLLIGKPIFNIINTFSFALLILLIYYHAFLTIKKIKALPIIFIFFSLFMFTPDFGQSYLWLTGSSNYLYGPILVLIFLIPYRINFEHSKNHKKLTSILFAIFMLFIGVLAGNTNENSGVTLVVVTLAFVIHKIKQEKKLHLWYITSFIGITVGCAFMLLSPGTKSRLGDAGLQLSQVFKRVILMTFSLLENFWGLFVIFFILILLCLVMLNRKLTNSNVAVIIKHLKFPIVYFMIFLISFYSLSASPGFPNRVWSTFITFFIISIVLLYDTFLSLLSTEDKYTYSKNLTNIIMSLCFISIILGTFANNFFQLKLVHISYTERINLISIAKLENKNHVYLPSISSNSKYSCFKSNGDLVDEYNSWENASIASYFDLDAVYKIN